MISLITFFNIIFCTDAYKVLLVAPFPMRSLSILGEGYVRNLIAAGHEVTFITAFPSKDNNGTKFRQIDVSDNFKGLPSGDGYDTESILRGEIMQFDLQMMQTGAVYNAILTFENENVRRLLEDPNENFDVVIVDFFETEMYSALAALYDCPMIWSYSMGAHWQVLRLIDEPTNPAYTSDYLSTNVLPFSFQQRLEELWGQIKWQWLKHSTTLPMEKEAYHKYFKPLLAKRGKSLPDYNELIYNASLIFGNENLASGNIPATPQNFKLIGGYHIETPPKPLPKDLQNLMDKSKDGVIYFSMGSNWKSKDLPKSIIEGLLKIFGELMQTVIWKFEETLSNTPKNVHIVNWAPQPSILAHPKCLLFISHGGLLSSTEAIHFGVPIIGVPILFDQILNVNRAEAKGYALKVPFTYNLPQDLKAAIDTMLKDPKFKRTVKEISSIYHDRPVPPGKEMVHWIEHVVRTRGAPHLRSPALNVPAYRKMFLDLAAVVMMSIILLLVAVRAIYKKLWQKGKVKKEKTN